MPCYYPLQGYRSQTLNESGKRSIVFNPTHGYVDMPITVPCGQCIGCRLEHSRQWAVRSIHEAQMWPDNCFITLTYRPEDYPETGSLVKRDFQLFMKRLRKRNYIRAINPETGRYKNYYKKMRYLMCGEYGSKTNRAHYHALLFNHTFTDKKLWKVNNNGDRLYISEELEDIWEKGFATIGNVTFQSAAYTARYVTKKIKGTTDKAEMARLFKYNDINIHTGEISEPRIIDGKIKHTKEEEYLTQSKGIGRRWFKKYWKDVYPEDYVILKNKKIRPPKFYDELLKETEPDLHRKVVNKRLKQIEENKDEYQLDRLMAKEQIQMSKYKHLHRGYENES